MISIPSNARVCFVGDSITANNGYISYIQDYFYKNRNADKIKFYNCGASGGSSSSNNISPFDLINIKRVAWGVREFEEVRNDAGASHSNCCLDKESIEYIVSAVMKKLI